MESAAVLGALDQDIAAEILPSTSTAIESDEEALKISVIDVVADMIVIYGCRDVLSWCRSAAGDSDNGRSFINELIDIVMCKKTGPLLCVKACECLAKIVMAESLSTEDNYLIEALVALISRYSSFAY
ncbi:unnamed protein product [Cylicostephanus goldi]|uniref:Nuclear condensin complex subunit 3 C-terminal domain-containing protein n=1 Tax=Cylicostephanus goldi TaxID=71465 RepID=A0A3P6UMR1_CYLGO|nr:unnamed protein product [Cylicostephanus goldi]